MRVTRDMSILGAEDSVLHTELDEGILVTSYQITSDTMNIRIKRPDLSWSKLDWLY